MRNPVKSSKTMSSRRSLNIVCSCFVSNTCYCLISIFSFVVLTSAIVVLVGVSVVHGAGGGHVTKTGAQGAERGHTVTVGHGSGGGHVSGHGHVTAGLVVVVGVSVVHGTDGGHVIVGVLGNGARGGQGVGRGHGLGGGHGAHGAGRGHVTAGHLEAVGHGVGGGHSSAVVGESVVVVDAAASSSGALSLCWQSRYFSTSLVTYRCKSSLASLKVKFNGLLFQKNDTYFCHHLLVGRNFPASLQDREPCWRAVLVLLGLAHDGLRVGMVHRVADLQGSSDRIGLQLRRLKWALTSFLFLAKHSLRAGKWLPGELE